VRLFENTYGEIEDAAIRKKSLAAWTESAGSSCHTAMMLFPKSLLTVDLLTTGIDVPKITNLVFLRRVNSRILYEQMLGRATRLCPDIGKEIFRIFDAVDLYENLQNLTDMKPVAANPSIKLTQLFQELSEIDDDVYRMSTRDQIIVKMRRRLGSLTPEA